LEERGGWMLRTTQESLQQGVVVIISPHRNTGTMIPCSPIEALTIDLSLVQVILNSGYLSRTNPYAHVPILYRITDTVEVALILRFLS
jgi:hypothetical protein